MKGNRKRQRILVGTLILGLLLALTVGLSQAQAPEPRGVAAPGAPAGTAFTYQGHLSDGGSPADGSYDFQFILYNGLSGGSQVGSTVTEEDVDVADGIFTVPLDFGSVFDGTGLWLEAGVRPGSSTGNFTVLSPRQEITPAPYALYAINIPQHDHFGQSWSGSATAAQGNENGLEVQNTSSDDGAGGVRGASASPNNGRGVFGHATAVTGTTSGVYGLSDSTAGRGVVGHAGAITGTTSGVYGSSASPSGYGGYFTHTAGGIPLYVDGDVAQSWTGDGLVKAGVVAQCNDSGALINRSFNNVAPFEEIDISDGAYAGACIISFPFRIADRYWVATTLPSGNLDARIVNCLAFALSSDLLCFRYDASGVGEDGAILVLVY